MKNMHNLNKLSLVEINTICNKQARKFTILVQFTVTRLLLLYYFNYCSKSSTERPIFYVLY
jgi:hypothetical protein